MPYWLYVNGRAEDMYSDYDAALKAMNGLIERLKKKGYAVKPHPSDADRFSLTHTREGSVEVYVHDEPPGVDRD